MIGTVMTWTAPTLLANGEPLPGGFIAGYHIYMGDTSAVEDGIAWDVGPTPTSVAFSSIPGAAVGKWFAITAFSAAGFESAQTAPEQWNGTQAMTPHFVLF